MRLAAPLAPLAIAFALVGCRTPAGPDPLTGAVPPEAHTLTQIVADLQLHLRDDTYALDRTREQDGQNVFAVALWRLDRLQRARGGPGPFRAYADVVIEFARARSLERLRRYAEARDAYARVAGTGSLLAAPADEAREVMSRFARHAGPAELPPATPDEEHRLIRRRVEKWRSLVLEYRATPYAPLAREEQESWEMLAVEWYARNSEPERAIQAARRLVERHHGSKFYAKHLIRLGDLHAEAARHEYLRWRAGMQPFDAARYERLLDRAFSAYELAGEERRPAQRREAKKKIEALLAYHEGVHAHAP